MFTYSPYSHPCQGRKVAFILYLSEDTWTEADGGLLQVILAIDWLRTLILASDWLRTLILTSDWLMLQLFDTDSLGNPGSVAASLVPRPNSFALFEVSPVSFHAVSEVLSETKTRQALCCWQRSEIELLQIKQLHFAIHHWGTTPVFLHSASGLR